MLSNWSRFLPKGVTGNKTITNGRAGNKNANPYVKRMIILKQNFFLLLAFINTFSFESKKSLFSVVSLP